MTLAEFKAWFDGFTEDMEGTPSAKQWARVQERVKEITGTPVIYPVYIDRYWNRPYYWHGLNTGGALYESALGLGGNMAQSYSANRADAVQCGDVLTIAAQRGTFDSTAAMYTAGKADAQDLAA